MRNQMRGVLMTGALVVLFAGTAVATDRIGPSGTILSEGLVTDSVHYNTGDIKFQTKKPVKIFHQTITFPANSTSGWHAHPGVVMVTVTSGELTHYFSDCSSETVTTGGAFVESGEDHATMVHSDVETVVHVTYVVPEGTTRPQLRIGKDDPGCAGNLH